MTRYHVSLRVLFLVLVLSLPATVCGANSFPQGLRGLQQAGLLERLQEKALRLTMREGQQLLEVAWPAATLAGRFLGQGLIYTRASIVEGERAAEGYAIITRIRYLNLLGIENYLDLAFSYDEKGRETGIQFAGYSDELSPMPPRYMPPHVLLNRIK